MEGEGGAGLATGAYTGGARPDSRGPSRPRPDMGVTPVESRFWGVLDNRF